MLQSQVSLEQQLLNLPLGERAKIALELLDSLELSDSSASKDSIEKKWVNESIRRLEAYQRGEMESYSLEDVIADLELPKSETD